MPAYRTGFEESSDGVVGIANLTISTRVIYIQFQSSKDILFIYLFFLSIFFYLQFSLSFEIYILRKCLRI